MKKYKPLEKMTTKEWNSFMDDMVIKPLKDELRRRRRARRKGGR